MQKLLDELRAQSITLAPDLAQPKQRHGSQYLFTETKIINGKTVAFVHYGDFKTGLEGSWSGDLNGAELTDEEAKLAKKELKAQRKVADQEKILNHERMALEAAALWESAADRGTHPYLEQKKVRLHGCRILPNEYDGVLLVPLRDITGKLWNVQRIYAKKFEHGNKFLLPEARKEGCFYLFSPNGEIHPEGVIYVGEGYATVATVFEALGGSQVCVAALDTGNLTAVGTALRSAYPSAKLVFCADNDAYGARDGRPYNAGLEAAHRAASEVSGQIVFPRFTESDQARLAKPTDFNDLAELHGLTTVREQIESPEKFKPEGEIVPLITKGKPTEVQLAEALLKEFDNRIIKEGSEVFVYQRTHWVYVGKRLSDQLKNMLCLLANAKLGSRDVENTYRTFVRMLPHVPKNISLFTPNPLAANFSNGTLHLYKNSDQSYRLEFLPHKKTDYLTSALPFEYEPANQEKNEEFEAMLNRVWHGDGDIKEKVRLYAQFLGACLIGAFPMIFLFVGKPKTGKSTLIQIAARLVDKENRCSVDPSQFEGFNLSSMVGKLVNFDPDISLRKPISAELVKKIVDRWPFRIQVKHKDDMYGFIPAIHAFGANGLPKSFEGVTGSMDRRAIVIRTEKFQPVGQYDKEYHDWLFEKNPQGIINFAVRGLHDLIDQKGHYSVPESAFMEMQQWNRESDPVAQFIHEARFVDDEGRVAGIEYGNDRVFVEKGGRIERKKLWEFYKSWYADEFRLAPYMRRELVFRRLEELGFPVKTINGVRYFEGLGHKIGASCTQGASF